MFKQESMLLMENIGGQWSSKIICWVIVNCENAEWSWFQMVDGRGNMQHGRAPWASLCPAWPGCQPGTCSRSPSLQSRAPPPPGWDLSPSRSWGWNKLAPAVQIQPVCIVKTLSSLLATRRGMGSSLELLHICATVHQASPQDLQWVCEWVFKFK